MSQKEQIEPVHPGEILLADFLEPTGTTHQDLARTIGVPDTVIADVIRGEAGITLDLASRLSKHFGTSVELWMNLQSHYEHRVGAVVAV